MLNYTDVRAALDDFRFLTFWAEPWDNEAVKVGVILNISESYTDNMLDQASAHLRGLGYKVGKARGTGCLKTIKVSK